MTEARGAVSALTREQRQQARGRQRKEERVPHRLALAGREKADRSQERVDRVHPAEERQQLPRGDPEREPLATGRAREVEGELGGKRAEVERPLAPAGGRAREQREQE